MLFNKTLDRQLEYRPREVRFCTKCVVSNQRPRITFDKEGVCSACQYAYLKHHVINWNEREKMLIDLLDQHRSKTGNYDCIVPGSGGKDSVLVAHQLKHKYGMHPLTVTWAPFIYTDIGWKNYIRFKDSGFDNILGFPNGQLHRKLTRLSFELLGDPFEPFTFGQKSFCFHLAIKFKIPLIFYGERGDVEYGGSTKDLNKTYESPSDWNQYYWKGSGIDELVQCGLESGLITQEEVAHHRFEFYKAPSQQELQDVNPQMHWFSFYRKWVPQENYYYAVENTGFQANPEGRSEGTYSKYASLDDRLDGFHYYMAYIKLGLGRTTSDAAHEIRDGHLTREEAVVLIHRYDGEFPKKYFKQFLQYINMTEIEFYEVVDFYRSLVSHLWEKVNGQWYLKYRVS